MKTELVRSYPPNSSSSLSSATSKISVEFEHGDSYTLPESVLSNNDNDNRARNNVENCCAKIMSPKAARRVFPIVEWIATYNLEKLMADLVAGVTIGLTVLPQGLAYASLAGLPPQYGLYSSFVGCFMYILFGSTKSVTIGPTAVLAIMTLTYSSGKPPEYGVLLAFVTGLMTLLLGVFRLGFIVNFISAPVNSAFATAAAITICSTQIKALLGLSYKTEGESFLSIIEGAIDRMPFVEMNDTLLSGACIVVLFFFQQIPRIASAFLKTDSKLYKILWLLSVARNAIVIVICTILFSVMGLREIPVKVVGNITSGLPPLQMPPLYIFDSISNATYSIGTLIKEDTTAIIVMPLLAIFEHINIAKAFAGNSRVDANQELISIGISNVLGACFSSMTVTGSFSRTTVNHASGVQSPLGGLFTGVMVLLSLQFLTPYFYFIPKSSLAAVIIMAVINMMEFPILYPMWKTKKMDILPWIMTFFVSMIFSLELGILTGLLISIIFLLYYAARPIVRVSKGETQAGYQFILVSSDRSLVFPAVEYTRYIILKSGQICGNGSVPVVIDCEHIQYVDFTAALGIRDLFQLFKDNGQELILWRIKPSIVKILTHVMEVNKTSFKHCTTEVELEQLLHSHSLLKECAFEAKMRAKVNTRRKAVIGNVSISNCD